jgi:hypothetical protein
MMVMMTASKERYDRLYDTVRRIVNRDRDRKAFDYRIKYRVRAKAAAIAVLMKFTASFVMI